MTGAPALIDPTHGRPLRVATLAAHPGTLERATWRALPAAGVEVVLDLGVADARSFGERAQALRDARPAERARDDVSLACLAGPDRDLPARLPEVIDYACQRRFSRAPPGAPREAIAH